MPLQNRVTPFGEIIASEARGTMMGNRGGKFHRDGKTLGRRRWASHHWICCDLHYKNQHHEPMGKGYTSLFFLDEVTALAAGHRPCFFCRRADAKRFFALMEPKLTLDVADRLAHQQRLASASTLTLRSIAAGDASKGRTHATSVRASRRATRAPQHEEHQKLPDGAMVAIGDDAFAIRGGKLLRWSPFGYTEAIPRASAMTARLLTPPLYVGILARGYEPRWHRSALEIGGAA
jgi:hypothetical protein